MATIDMNSGATTRELLLRLSSYGKEQNLTSHELAEELEIPYSTVQRWWFFTQGKSARAPSEPHLNRVREFLESKNQPEVYRQIKEARHRAEKIRYLLLASASPRRKDLLRKTGLRFEVDPSDYREDITLKLEPHELAKHLSLEKARSVAQRHPGALIIAADTFGVFRGKILGKPRTEAEARSMLETINGRMHRVITGLTIMDTGSARTVTRSVETKVYFRKLTPQEIEEYVKSGEPLDKAGGYAIQGLGSTIVRRIEGDFYNVVGLPLSTLAETLIEFDIYVLHRKRRLRRSDET